MNYLKVLDPLDNEVFFDHKSIGLAILNSELSSNVHALIRKTLSNPAAILEIDEENRIYIFVTLDFWIRTINVLFNGDFWYVKDINVGNSKEELLKLIQKHKVIYTK
jgi:hypothetical protein